MGSICCKYQKKPPIIKDFEILVDRNKIGPTIIFANEPLILANDYRLL